MFGFITSIPRRIKHLLAKFKSFFTKPQYKNFCRTEFGLMVAQEGEHDVKSTNKLFIDRKDQSALNRFFTDPKWDTNSIVKEGKALLQNEEKLDTSLEYEIFDDTVCRKYSQSTEMVCYNHSSTMGTVLSHDYVTSLCVNNDLAVPDELRLYGSKKKCQEKSVEFKTKVQLACDIIEEHVSRAKQTICLWDSWFTCQEMAKRCKKRGFNWIGEIKSNRIVYCEGEKLHLNELVDVLCSRGAFVDVVVDGEVYLAAKANVYLPNVGSVAIVVNVKADTRDMHILCSDLCEFSLYEIVFHALQRCKIETFHKEVEALGFGEYRFQASEAALIHAHLVVLAYALLDTLRRRLLRYSIVKSLFSIEGTVEWVRKKAGHLFMHEVRNSKLPNRSLLRLIDTK